MRDFARMIFDKDAPLSFLFHPFYYLAEIIYLGFQATDLVRRKGEGRQTLETRTGVTGDGDPVILSAQLETTLRRGEDGVRPGKIKAIKLFWQDEELVRFVGFSIAYNRLVKLVEDLKEASFPRVLDRLGALQKQKVLVKGAAAQEVVEGGDGNDVIKTRGGDDSIVASGGRDKINGGRGEDAYVAGRHDGKLTVDLARGVARKAGEGRDKIKKIEDVVGSSKRDVLRGDGGENELSGAAGGDEILGRGGSDTIFGGLGDDELFGGRGADRIFGDDGDDELFGGGGADFLFGGADADTLDGGPGVDVLTGGAGADEFVIDPSDPGGPDEAVDYDHAQGDRLRLPGEAADYALQVIDGSTLVRRIEGGAVVAVLPGDAGGAVLDDAFYGL